MKNIAIFLGGKSAEKKVSKASGAAVINALRTHKEYKILRCDPADKEQMKNFLDLVSHGKIDGVFNALHGTGAEDGEMQGFLRTLDIPFTGPQVHGAAVAFDKITTKRVLRDSNISVSQDITFEQVGEKWCISHNGSAQEESVIYQSIDEKILQQWGEKINYKGFAKAAREGSSFGVFPIHDEKEFLKILPEMMQQYSRILFEKKCSGTEVTNAVVDGKALEMTEIVAEKGEFYDYESKYADGGSSHYLPPRNISASAKEKFQKISEKIGFLLDLQCPYRVDGFIDGEEFWIIEINTLPGMTDTSLLPEAYKFQGEKYSFAQMCEEMIEQSIASKTKVL